MVISRKKLPPQPSLQICGEQIEFVSSFKLLGIIVTNNLSWTPHIMFSISKAKRLIGFLFRVFKEADKLNCTRLLFCLILNTVRVFGILLSLSILLPWRVFSHLLPVWLQTLGPLSLLLWWSRFSGPRSVNAAIFKNSVYVAEFSVVFQSFLRLFSLYLLTLSPPTRTPFLFTTLS